MTLWDLEQLAKKGITVAFCWGGKKFEACLGDKDGNIIARAESAALDQAVDNALIVMREKEKQSNKENPAARPRVLIQRSSSSAYSSCASCGTHLGYPAPYPGAVCRACAAPKP